MPPEAGPPEAGPHETGPHEAGASAPLGAAPIEVRGEWHAPPASAAAVVTRMRDACVTGYRLLSDRQPQKLWVENRPSGPPAIWLHASPQEVAWVFVDVGERDWSRLAYQFGHELGHVVCNSWRADAKPSPPCQWVEEMLVETFSVRGLRLLADGWAESPPFPDDAGFARSIREYRAAILTRYGRLAAAQGFGEARTWFAAQREALEASNGLSDAAKAAVPLVVAAFERDTGLLEDMGALNRWPGRTAEPMGDYLRQWQASCSELGSPGRLPALIAETFLRSPA